MSTKEIRPALSPSVVCRWALCGALVWGGLLPSGPLMGEPVSADPESDSIWWQQSEVVASLNLSSDQVSTLETELMAHRQEIGRLLTHFDQEQDRLEVLMEDPGALSADLQDQMRRAIESRGALEVAHGGFLLAIREVLNPVQWQALKEYSQEHLLALDPTRPMPPRPPEPPSPASAPSPVVAPAPKVVPDPPNPASPPQAPAVATVPEPAMAPSPALRPAPTARSPRVAPTPSMAPPAPVAPRAVAVPKPSDPPAPAVAAPDSPEAPSIDPVVAPSLPPAAPQPAAPLPPAPPAPTVWWHDRASQDLLSLSRRQVDRLDQVANRHALRLEAIQDSIARVERELGPIIDADEVESATARDKLAELGRARMELRLALRDMDLELREILSGDQRSLLSRGKPENGSVRAR